MDLTRRALLVGVSGVPLLRHNPQWKPKAVCTSAMSTRRLHGLRAYDPAAFRHTPFYDDDMDGLELEHARFCVSEWVGPYLNERNDEARFRKRAKLVLANPGSAPEVPIHQGLIGDCWFLSALDFSLYHPHYQTRVRTQLIREVPGDHGRIKTGALDQAAPMAAVTLFDAASATWNTAVVGPTALLAHHFPATLSAISNDPEELWPTMVEKGLAKMCRKEGGVRGYAALGGGWMSEGMTMLHGPGEGHFLPQSELVAGVLRTPGSVADFVGHLRRMLDERFGLFVVWDKETFKQFAQGLVAHHAYAVVGVDVAAGTLTLKNPWSRGVFRAADADSVTPSYGVFTMAAAEVLARCAGIDVYTPPHARLRDHGIASVPYEPQLHVDANYSGTSG